MKMLVGRTRYLSPFTNLPRDLRPLTTTRNLELYESCMPYTACNKNTRYAQNDAHAVTLDIFFIHITTLIVINNIHR